MTRSKEDRIAALETAISRGGGVVRFSKALGISTQAIYHWKRRGWVPVDKALIIEALFGVPREDTLEPSFVALMQTPSAPSADIL